MNLYMYKDVLILTAYCSLIFYLSHQPTLPMPMGFPHQDKLVHATAYGIMAVLAWRSFIHLNQSNRFILCSTLIFCSLYGVSDEFHQSFIIGRDADIWDWLADTFGAALALLTIAWSGYKYDSRR